MISNLAKSIAPSSTLEITAKANAMKAEGIDVVGFVAGEPDFDTPEYIKKAAIAAIEGGFTKYTPAAGTLSLREVICNKLRRDNQVEYTPAQIVVSNGAKHSLTNTFMAILNPGDEVIIPAPYWLSYPEMVKMAHGSPKILEAQRENQFKITPQQFEESITEKTRAIIINSPSNPTGVVYTKSELQEIAAVALKHDLYIISDEIYEYLVYGDVKHTCIASLSPEIYAHTITINGVSKSHAMTGWRIGYVAAPLEVAKAISNLQSHATSNPNSIAQKAAEVAIDKEGDFIKEMVKSFESRSQLMYEGIKEVPYLEAIKPQGAFYCFIDVSKLYGKMYEEEVINSAADLARLLIERENVAIIPCKDFGAKDCIRLSYAINPQSIEEGINRIKKFVGQLK